MLVVLLICCFHHKQNIQSVIFNVKIQSHTFALSLECLHVRTDAGLEHSGSDWITTEIEVRIRESHGDDDFINQTGIVRNISVYISRLIIKYCVCVLLCYIAR